MRVRRGFAAPRADAWTGPLLGFAAGGLIGNLLFGGAGLGAGPVRLVDVVLAGLVLFLIIMRRRRPGRGRATREVPDVPSVSDTSPVRTTVEDDPSRRLDLDRGVEDIRRTDPRFDPTRFAGYAGMMFRDAQTAWMLRDIAPLRHRLTAEMYGGLQAQCHRLRSMCRSSRVDEIEVQTEVTEAWQESGRDYVTAYVAGSMVDYTVDDASDGLVEGSRTIPRAIEEFWTFTRPSGLNFWMLSAIQTS